jgi:phosphatidylserine/phosphatidylglycerophosphate/cardiolipin synthase-like enzyme
MNKAKIIFFYERKILIEKEIHSSMGKKALIICIIALIIIIGCTKKIPTSEGKMEFYSCHQTNCSEKFIELIKDSTDISCAFYEIHNKELLYLLEKKHAEIIVDENAELEIFTTRTGDGLMHNKFCIINDSTIITGSYNPASTMNTYDNILIISSAPIAAHYQKQFDNILKKKKPHSKNTVFDHNNQRIEILACPQDSCTKRVNEIIATAKHNISFALFTFTDTSISASLIAAHEREVNIQGIIESYQAKKYNQYYTLLEKNISVALEGTAKLQHNKVFVIDERIVITGSYNPTKAANSKNEENIIIIYDEETALFYTAMIEDIFKETQSFK